MGSGAERGGEGEGQSKENSLKQMSFAFRMYQVTGERRLVIKKEQKNLQENTEDSAGVQEVYKINLEYFLKVGFEGNQERGIPGLGVIYPSLLEVEPSSNRNISNLYHLN